ADDIGQAQLRDLCPKLAVVAITRIGQYRRRLYSIFNSFLNLYQSDLDFRFETNIGRNACLFTALLILSPRLRKIQPPGNWQTRCRRSNRKAHCYPAVVLLAQLAAVLPGDADRVRTLLGKARVVDNPGFDLSVLLHGRQDTLPNPTQHYLVVPRRISDDMVQ